MAITSLSDLSNVLSTPGSLSSLLDNPLGRTVGQQLKHDLGLDNFTYVMIQKIVNLPLHVYIVTYDSRRPTLYVSPYRIKTANTVQLKQVKQNLLSYSMKNFKLTPPLLIDRAAPLVGTGTIILCKDLSGEYIANKKLSKKMTESEDIKVVFLDE